MLSTLLISDLIKLRIEAAAFELLVMVEPRGPVALPTVVDMLPLLCLFRYFAYWELAAIPTTDCLVP